MSRTLINGLIQSTQLTRGHHRRVVCSPAGNLYYFSLNASNAVFYSKSTDQGATWGAAVSCSGGLGTVVAWDIQFEGDAPSGRTNVVHILIATDSGTRGLYYNQLDLSTDTLGGTHAIAAWAANPNAWCSITASKDHGTLYATYGGNASGSSKSVNDGVTWTGLANMSAANNVDFVECQPDVASANGADVCGIYFTSATKVLSIKRHNIGLNTITTTTIATLAATRVGGPAANGITLATSLNTSNGHIMIAVWDVTAGGTGSNTLRIFDVFGTSITTLTSAVSGVTFCNNVASSYADNNWAVFYQRDPGGTTLANEQQYRKISIDGGVTWSSETNMDSNTSQNFNQGTSAHLNAGDQRISTWETGGNAYTATPAQVVPGKRFRTLVGVGT